MFKKIPQDQITRRLFNVFKNVELTQDDVTVFQVHNVTGSFDADTEPLVGASGSFPGFSKRGLYNSAKLRYYNTSGSLIEHGGGFSTKQKYVTEAPTTMSILSFAQCVRGEAVLPGSFQLVDSGSGLTVVDNEGSNVITNTTPEYAFDSIDFNTGQVTLTNGTILVIESIDYNTGETEISYQGDFENPNPILVNTNLTGSTLVFEGPLSILEEIQDAATAYGNLFAKSGDLVIDTGQNPGFLETFDLSFKSTTPISEMEILINVEPGEFTTSTNPTALDFFNITSESFEHTMTDENGNPFVETIKNFTPRKKEHIYSSYADATGSFNDYEASSSLDPTGSYLTTYVTSVGLYNDDSELLAIAKMARPIKILPDYPINFLIKLDL
tara:strand:+ start:5638 stop:6789 length:1152 start_codon:yes stop_codon:yes gene_type:complete